MKVLLITPTAKSSAILTDTLENEGFFVDPYIDSVDGLHFALLDLYDIVVLDTDLVPIDGFDVLTKMRKHDIQTPVVFISAVMDSCETVRFLNAGADDYLSKPYDPNELIARINALFRRYSTLKICKTYNIGKLRFNPKLLTLSSENNQVNLPYKEGKILELLIQKKGTPISVGFIIERVWDDECIYVSDVLLRQHICKLRKKIKKMDASVDIKVVRKVGYMLLSKD